jgi:hypothetical protein
MEASSPDLLVVKEQNPQSKAQGFQNRIVMRREADGQQSIRTAGRSRQIDLEMVISGVPDMTTTR